MAFNTVSSLSAEQLDRAVTVLQRGELLGLPTETVYGLACDASNLHALQKLYAVKGRPQKHPVIVHVASAAQLFYWAQPVTPTMLKLAEAFWPGPLTMIVPKADHVLDALTGGQSTVGLRVPNHPMALAILEAFGGGVAAPSANRFGCVSPTTAQHVADDLGDDVACIIDGGPCAVGVESTIVDLSGLTPRILRPGFILPQQLEAVLGLALPHHHAEQANAPRVSGSLPSHYAPVKPLYLLKPNEIEAQCQLLQQQGLRVALLQLEDKNVACTTCIQMPVSSEAYAQTLYAMLRQLDANVDIDVMMVEMPPQKTEWAAVTDRLMRAAAPKIPDIASVTSPD